MTCQGVPPCCDQCCTHRLFDPEIDWSESVVNKQICGAGLDAAPTVVDSWRNGDYVYFVAEIPRLVDGVVRFGYRAEKWSKTGTRQWKTAILFTTTDTGFNDQDRTKAAAICSDGTTVWVAIAENDLTGSPTGLSKVWRLNASTGAVAFAGAAGAGDSLTVYSMAPTGDGKVYIGHGLATGYYWVSTWDDDTLTDRFGVFGAVPGGGDFYVSSIVPDGSDIYLGHTVIGTDRFGPCQADPCDLCGPTGAVSRWNGDRELVWLSYGGSQAKIAKVGSTVFVAALNSPVYGALDDEWGDPEWFRQLDVTEDDDACGMQITDIDADASHVWLSACRYVVQTDHLGIEEAFVPHVHEDDIPFWNESPYTPNGNQVLTVAAIQDGTAVGGGRANLCDPETPLEPEERTTSEVTCDDEATDFCTSSVPGPGCGGGGSLGEDNLCYAQTNVGWCNINQCGVVSTNGRVAISECTDHEQWPKCSGPGIITYTDCNDEVVTETLRFSSHCVDGGWRWFTSWDGGSLAFTVPCDGSFGPDDIDLVIDGCTTTVDTATITCDGPLGYASMEFTFSGSCSSCNINGCGAFGAEECEPAEDLCGCTEVPDTLYATLTNVLFCECADATVVTLTRDGSTWSGSTAFGGCGGKTITVDLTCNPPDWELAITITDCTVLVNLPLTVNCDPLEISAIVNVPFCCQIAAGNSFEITITA